MTYLNFRLFGCYLHRLGTVGSNIKRQDKKYNSIIRRCDGSIPHVSASYKLCYIQILINIEKSRPRMVDE